MDSLNGISVSCAFACKLYIVIVLGLLFVAQPASSSPLTAPLAITKSSITLTAEFEQAFFIPYFPPHPITTATAKAADEVFATYPQSGYFGSSYSSIAVSTPDDPDPTESMVFTFDMDQGTKAMAMTPNPGFAESIALSKGGAYGALIPSMPVGSQPSLKLTWNVDELYMLTNSKSAFSMMRHTVDFTEWVSGEDKSTTTTLGFEVLGSGDSRTITSFNLGGDGLFNDWFIKNTKTTSAGEAQSIGGPSVFSVDVPLSVNDSDYSRVSVRVNHLEYSEVSVEEILSPPICEPSDEPCLKDLSTKQSQSISEPSVASLIVIGFIGWLVIQNRQRQQLKERAVLLCRMLKLTAQLR